MNTCKKKRREGRKDLIPVPIQPVNIPALLKNHLSASCLGCDCRLGLCLQVQLLASHFVIRSCTRQIIVAYRYLPCLLITHCITSSSLHRKFSHSSVVHICQHKRMGTKGWEQRLRSRGLESIAQLVSSLAQFIFLHAISKTEAHKNEPHQTNQ